MRKLFFFILIAIFGLVAVSPALAQDGGATALEITSPKESDLITGDEILLNIKFSSESGNHAHIWLDEPSPTADNLKSQETPGPLLFRDVKPGDHTIIVELAGSDHKPVDPAQKITLKVKTRSAADVTQEEIAKALSQIKPTEKENTQNIDPIPQESDNLSTWDLQKQFKPFLIIGAVLGFIIIGGLIFFILRRKKQQ